MRHAIPIFLMMVACEKTGSVGGQSGTVNPAECVEVSRDEVTDTSVAPDGFTHSVDEILAHIEGHWAGSLDLDTAATPVSLSLTQVGPVYASRTEVNETEQQGNGPSPGSPNILCGQAYELEVDGVLTAGSALNESFHVTFRAVDDGRIEVFTSIDLSDLHGDLQPNFDPADWDTTALSVSFVSVPADDETRLSLSWTGTNDGSGTTSPVGSTLLTRP